MKEIKIANKVGYCWGVDRAVKLVLDSLKMSNSGKIYTLGPLMHNDQAIKELESCGIFVVKNPKEVPAGETLVLSTHGVSPEILEELNENGLNIIDSTCPIVSRLHKIATEFGSKNYSMIILGDKKHKEVIATIGYIKKTGSEFFVISSIKEAEDLPQREKYCLIAQTTQNKELFKQVQPIIKSKCNTLMVQNTLCGATKTRQEEIKELAPEVDLVIVVGGKESANTRRLKEISESLGTKAIHISTPEEIDINILKDIQKIAITGGASTPEKQIYAVVDFIKKISE